MPQTARRKAHPPSPLSLLLTSIVALALFTGIVIVSKTLPVEPQSETTGSASPSDAPQPKAPEHSVPARAR